MSALVRLRLLPSAKCLYTQPVQLLVDGLRSSQVVTMNARATDDKGVLFHASAVYRADCSGAVDLWKYPSLGGSYVGVEPMGLLWSLSATALHTKFYKSDSRTPHLVTFSVHKGEAGAGPALAEATNERLVLADGVGRTPIQEGNVRGVFFVPPGAGKTPRGSMASLVRLRLLPSAKCLYTQPVQLLVDGLRSSQVVTMNARATDDKGVLFHASAVYRADSSGAVDLWKDPSLGGSYVGVEPMGLLWSLRAAALHTKFYKSDSRRPHLVTFSVHKGEAGAGPVLAEATNERLVLADGVGRTPIKEGKVRGMLFVPPGEGPFPAVLDLYTFGGGLSERRASLLANCGFMVLTVSLYGLDDQPKKVSEIHLEYFEEAIQLLRKHPKAIVSGVGVISISKSGDLALSIASHLPNVKAVVGINGCCSNIAIPLYYRGSELHSTLMYNISRVKVTESGALNIKHGLDDPLSPENEGSLIPIERAAVRFLFVAAEDDQNWDSVLYANIMEERLRRQGKDNFEKVVYPGAGHYLEPPYGPYCPSSFHGVVGAPTVWGGEPKAHAAAEVHLWNKIQEFFRTHLVPETGAANARL